MEWHLRPRRKCPSLVEGICKQVDRHRLSSFFGLFSTRVALRSVIWLTILSGLQVVYGINTGNGWTQTSPMVTESLQFTGTTEPSDLVDLNDIEHSSLISDTQTTICHTQCTAGCSDSELLIPPVLTDGTEQENVTMVSPEVSCPTFCETFTNDDWIEECATLVCIRNCGDPNHKSGTHLIPDPPYNLSLKQLTANVLYLEWMHDELITRHSVLYVVERKVQDTWESVNVTSHIFCTAVVDVCEKSNFQVASVNQFGYNGYSSSVTRSELPRPGPVEQMEMFEQPKYQDEFFYFMYKFNPPNGWSFADFKVTSVFYDKECSNIPVPPVPLTDVRKSSIWPETYELEISIHETGYGCKYYLGIMSYSKCDVEGDAFNFTVNITNCEVLNYECPEIPFRWPSMVENVQVEVVDSQMKAFVSWLAAEDTGSSDYISSYLVQWGLVRSYAGFQIPKLIEESQIRVPGDQFETVIYLNKTETLYGIKIIGVVPIKENETDELTEQIDKMASMDTFTVKSTSTAPSVVIASTLPNGHHPQLGTSVPSPASTTTFHVLVSSSLGMLPGTPKKDTKTLSTITRHKDNPDVTGNDLVALYISIPVVVIVVGVLAAVLLVIHKRKVQNKDTLPRQVFTQLPGYNASVMKQVQNCMESNQLYHIQTHRGEPPSPEGDYWEISRRHLTLGEILGRGAFGQVVKGRVQTGGIRNWRKISTSSTGSFTEDCNAEEITVAVKMLLEFAEDSHKQEFLKEMDLMKKIGHHTNVVSMIGCVTRQGPLCLIVEHVPHGDLLHYLRKHRQNIQEENSDSGIKEECPKLTIMDLLSMARQIATGMEFLSQKGFVHRDLACRNILVGENRVVKIGDFGLTRFIYDDKIYVTKKGGKLPLKWMAIESIFDLTFTSASDVWSFGVVMFELITLGGTPYPTIANKDLLRDLRAGHRMDRPDNCPDHLYEVMCNCWKERSRDRPTFTHLRNLMDSLIETHCTAEYMTFDINTTRDYYTLSDSNNSSTEEEETQRVSSAECSRAADMGDHTDVVEQVASLAIPEIEESRSSDGGRGLELREQGHSSSSNTAERAGSSPVRHKNRKCGSLSVISSPGLSMKMHSPLKVFRKEGDDMLSISTCSTDQLLATELATSAQSDSQTSLECNYEVLATKHNVKETRF